jgi:hypothetical protein
MKFRCGTLGTYFACLNEKLTGLEPAGRSLFQDSSGRVAYLTCSPSWCRRFLFS